MRWVIACLIAGFAQGLSAAAQEQGGLTRFTFTEYHMGIDARLVVYAPNEQTARSACESAFKRIAELDAIMSDYRQDSELMRLCGSAGKGAIPVSPDLFRVLDKAQTIAKQTDGGFDVTVGPLIQLWRKARKEQKLPNAADIEKAKKVVGFKKLHMNPKTSTATLDVPRMRLDLGGIAKGYASDEALKVLRSQGIQSALIEMGGDIVLGAAPPRREGWNISVPNAGQNMFLKDCAISSSGDTEQYVEIGKTRYSHVVDPRTGYGLTQRKQATVIAPDGFTSDPLSTALTLVAQKRREALLRHFPGVRTFIKIASD
ncbi:MAG: FAD:protein FMN transferase [Fimbriimonas sp.]